MDKLNYSKEWFDDLIFRAEFSGYINPNNSSIDDWVRPITITIDNYDEYDDSFEGDHEKVGTVLCTLYFSACQEGEDGCSVLDLMDDWDVDAFNTARVIEDEIDIDLDDEYIIVYVSGIQLNEKYTNCGIEQMILSKLRDIISSLIWQEPSLIIMCAKDEERHWLPNSAYIVKLNDRVAYCCIHSWELTRAEAKMNQTIQEILDYDPDDQKILYLNDYV